LKQQPKKKCKSLPVEVSERQNEDEMSDDMAFDYPHVVGTEDLIHQTVSGVTTSNPTNDDKMVLVVNAISSILKNKTVKKTKDKTILSAEEVIKIAAMNWELLCQTKGMNGK
jgi:hypothetical protein